MSYRRTLDEREFAVYAELFAPDGEWVGNLGSFKGPAAIKQMLDDSVGTAFGIDPGDDFHLVANPDIRVDGDRATASSTWVFVTRRRTTSRKSRSSGTTPTCSRARPTAGASCAERRSATSRRSTSASSSEERSAMSTSQRNGVAAGPVPPTTSTQLFVGGAWRDAADGATFAVISPTSEATLANVAAAGAADVDAAVEAARRQVDGGEWSQLSGADRGRLLYRLAEAMERDIEIFVALEAHDVGKPAFEPRMVDIPNAIDVIRHFAGWADKIEGAG